MAQKQGSPHRRSTKRDYGKPYSSLNKKPKTQGLVSPGCEGSQSRGIDTQNGAAVCGKQPECPVEVTQTVLRESSYRNHHLHTQAKKQKKTNSPKRQKWQPENLHEIRLQSTKTQNRWTSNVNDRNIFARIIFQILKKFFLFFNSNFKGIKWTEYVVVLVACLPCKPENLSLLSSTHIRKQNRRMLDFGLSSAPYLEWEDICPHLLRNSVTQQWLSW